MSCNICFITLMLAVAQTLVITHHHYHNAFVFLLLESLYFPIFFFLGRIISAQNPPWFIFPTGLNSFALLCVCAKSHLTLCDPMDCSPPGFLSHGNQIGVLEWVAMPGDLPGVDLPGDLLVSLMSPTLAGGFFTTSATQEAPWLALAFTVS